MSAASATTSQTLFQRGQLVKMSDKRRAREGTANDTLPASQKRAFPLFILVFLWAGYFFFSFFPLSVLLLSPPLPHTNSVCVQTEWRGSIFPISRENSRSVITLSQAIKPLPRSDRWQMLEGLFIFCLLIRAAGRGGERGVREWYRRRRRQADGEREGEKGRTPCSRPGNNFYLEFSPPPRVPPFDLLKFMWAAWHFWCGRSVIRQGYVKGSQPTGEWLSMIIRSSESPASYH